MSGRLAGKVALITGTAGGQGRAAALRFAAAPHRIRVNCVSPGMIETPATPATALRRVWRCTHFSWWMTSMLHTSGDDFDAQLQLSQLRWVTSSAAGAAGLAENYAGLDVATAPVEVG